MGNTRNIISTWWIRAYKHRVFLAGATLLTTLYLFLSLSVALTGPYNPDEGWYLHSSWLAWTGNVAYRDFGFPQPPLVLFAHGFFQRVFGPGFYLGRVINVGIGELALITSMVVAYRLSGTRASLLSGVLLAAAPWFSLQMATVSSYALASLFLALLILTLHMGRWKTAGILASAIVLTRLPLLLVIPMAAMYVAFVAHKKRWQALAHYTIGLLGAAGLVIGPFLLLARDKTIINIIGYHLTTRSDLLEYAKTAPDYFWWLIRRYLNVEYKPLYGSLWLIALLALVLILLANKSKVQQKQLYCFMVATSVIIAASQLPAMNSTYDVPLMVLLGIVAAQGMNLLVTAVTTLPVRIIAAAGLLFLVWKTIVTPQMPIYQGAGHSEETHYNIKRVAHYIQSHTSTDDYILTPELYVALEAKRSVVPGMELGRFFYFPNLSDDDASKRGVLNTQQLLQIISERKAKIIVINQNHHWQNFPRDPAEQEVLYEVIAQAGYQPAKELNLYQPTTEQLKIYELP